MMWNCEFSVQVVAATAMPCDLKWVVTRCYDVSAAIQTFEYITRRWTRRCFLDARKVDVN